MAFTNIRKNKGYFLKDPNYCKTEEGATNLICRDCDFYKEGEDENLACSGYLILKALLDKNIITVKDIIDVVGK